MPDPVTGSLTPQEAAIAGAGAVNPWAEYGLNPDGTPITKEEPKTDPRAVENAELKAKIAELEAKLSRVPDDIEGINKKMALVDKVVKAIAGPEGQDAETEAYQKIYGDLKRVARHANPGLLKTLEALESNPDAVDQIGASLGQLQTAQIVALNERAHDRVVDLAKKAGFKAGSPEEMNEIVFPFEQSITFMINSNEQLRKAFLAGDMGVVENIFNRLVRPHVAQRLKDKQAKARITVPSAVPRGAGTPTPDAGQEPPKRNIMTPQGKAAFHKEAVNRWLDKISQRDE